MLHIDVGPGRWIRLPEEMHERVLALLPLPTLCRSRSVCKAWNELSRTPRFLELWEDHNSNKPCLFLTRHLSPDRHGDGWSAVDGAHWRTTSFLDFESRRWYSIPHYPPPREGILRLLAFGDGLVFEISSLGDSYELAVYDPVAKTRHPLPATDTDGGRVVCRLGETDPNVDALPVVVITVDVGRSTFKVFCMNRDSTGLHTGFFVYESSRNAWRSLGTPPERLGLGPEDATTTAGRVLEESSVFFRGTLYAIFWYDDSNKNIVLGYNLEEDVWREVLVVDAENPKYPQLVVFGDRMFIAVWNIPFRLIGRDVHDVFEIMEVLVDSESSSRLVMVIRSADVETMSGELQFDIVCGFPLSSSICGGEIVLMISRKTGRLLTYDVRSGAVGAFPAHPLRLPEQLEVELEEHNLFPHYRANLSNLSLRNVLSAAR